MCQGDKFFQRIEKAINRHSVSRTDPLIGVSISQQRCYFFKSNLVDRVFPISTSRQPPSEKQDSYGTPRGLHEVAEKFGAGETEGMIFRGRKPVGKCFHQLAAEENQANLITSRILRLRGLEAGFNQGPGIDSFDRYIYFHGTNHEARIGEPFSGGCIEFRNSDIIELFEMTPRGTQVYIED